MIHRFQGLLHVSTPFGESAKDELLNKAGADPFRSTDCEISEDEANSAIRFGKIQVREAGCSQISAQAGVIWHGFSAVTPGDKWAEHRMPESRASCAGSLIEVTRVLMEQGRQYGASDHNVRKTISRGYADALTIGIPALPVLGTVSRLSGAGDEQNSGSSHWIGRRLQCKLKFHFCGERCRVLLIGDVEVGNESQHPLMFLGLELL